MENNLGVYDYYNGENSLNDKEETLRVAFAETGFTAENIEASHLIAAKLGRAGLPCMFLSEVTKLRT